MKHIFPKYNHFSTTFNICLAGLLIAIATICQKVLAINYIPSIPFFRASFGGPATIIFASIILGPYFGAFVGAASDLLGYVLFDPKNNAYFFQITILYAVLGFISYFVFNLVRKIKRDKISFIVMIAIAFCCLVPIILILSLNEELNLGGVTYTITLVYRIVVPIALFLLFAMVILFVFLFDHSQKKKGVVQNVSTYTLGLTSFVIEIIVMVGVGTTMKGWAFGWNLYLMILVVQIATLFINICLNTLILSTIFKTGKRFKIDFDRIESEENNF